MFWFLYTTQKIYEKIQCYHILTYSIITKSQSKVPFSFTYTHREQRSIDEKAFTIEIKQNHLDNQQDPINLEPAQLPCSGTSAMYIQQQSCQASAVSLLIREEDQLNLLSNVSVSISSFKIDHYTTTTFTCLVLFTCWNVP